MTDHRRDLDALSRLVRTESSRRSDGLRAVGSRTSKSDCFHTRGLEISLDSFRWAELVSDRRVRAGAGIILADLAAFLDRHDLSLPTLGEWTGQTLAGAVSTGTHGGAYRHGSLCSSLRKLVLMDGLGELRELAAGDPGFAHVMPSFGSTGILVELELECEDRFDLALSRRCLPLEDFLDELIANRAGAEFRSAVWLPGAGLVVDYAATRCETATTDARRRPRREPRFSNTANLCDWLSKRARRTPVGLLFRAKTYRGPAHEILAPLHGSAREILRRRRRYRGPLESEVAVPLAAVPDFVRALKDMFAARRAFPDRPLGIRPIAQERASLSATQDGPCGWISLFLRPRNPLRLNLPELLRSVGARPHWGKHTLLDPSAIAGLYPRWQAFKAFRDSLDPERIFINAYAAALGL